MENIKKYIISFLCFIIMFVTTFYIIFTGVDFDILINVFKNTNLIYIALGILMVLIYLYTQGVYTKIILKSMKKKCRTIKGFIYACIEFYFSAITPSSTGGQPVQIYYMKKDGLPISASTITAILTMTIFKIVLVVLGLLLIIFKPWIITGNGIVFNIIFAFGFLVNAIMIALCFMLMFSKEFLRKIVIGLIGLLTKIKIIKRPIEVSKKFVKMLEEYAKGMNYIKKNVPTVIKVTLLVVIQRVALFSIGYFVYLALGMTRFSYFDFLALQVAITIAIDSLPLPGGIGVSEAMLLILYKKVYIAEMIMPAMLLTRAISYYFCFVLTGLVTLINHIRIKTRDKRLKEEVSC